MKLRLIIHEYLITLLPHMASSQDLLYQAVTSLIGGGLALVAPLPEDAA
jgi:hypothetical protein